MEIGRGTDPDNVDIRIRDQFGPIAIGGRFRDVFLTTLFRALVGRVANGDNLNVRNFLERRQMAVLDHGSGADDPDFQFGLPRCHGEVPESDSLTVYSFKTKKFRNWIPFFVFRYRKHSSGMIMVGGVQIRWTQCSQVSWPLRISISTLK